MCVVSDTYLFWFSFFWPLFPARFRLSHNILASMGRILTHNMLCMDRGGRREANGAAVWKIVLRIYICMLYFDTDIIPYGDGSICSFVLFLFLLDCKSPLVL